MQLDNNPNLTLAKTLMLSSGFTCGRRDGAMNFTFWYIFEP